MELFFVTDNKVWFEKLTKWSKHNKIDVSLFCSPKGAINFSNEISEGWISVINVDQNKQWLIDRFDIGISCHCKQIFPKHLVESIPCFNFHPGFNPYNRGWFPQVFSLINNFPAGATLHRMDSQVDHGPIIAQEKVKICEWDDAKTLYNKILEAEFRIFDDYIPKLIKGNFDEYEMLDEGNYNSIKDFRQICELDLNRVQTIGETINLLRALTFDGYENAFFYTKDAKKVYISINLRLDDS